METLRCIPDGTLKLSGTEKEWHGEEKQPARTAQNVEVISSNLSYEGPLFRVYTDEIVENGREIDARRGAPQRFGGHPGHR